MRILTCLFFALLAGAAHAGMLGETAKGTTDYSVELKIIDSTDGTPETGVVFNTAGIDLWYRREGAASVDITEATLAALTTAHTDGGFLHINDGVYRLDLVDAALATGADFVYVGGTVTGMIVIGGRVKLTNVDMNDGVRAGMTALPNAAADAAGGLTISDAGGLDLDGLNTNVNDIETDTADMQPKLGTYSDLGSGATLSGNLEDMRDDGTAAFSRTTDSLQALRDRGDAAWTTGSAGSGLTAIATGTAQSATGTTLVLASSETFANDELIGSVLHITGGTAGVGQTKCITDNVGSTDTVTVDTWTTTPTGTITYEIVPSIGDNCPETSADIVNEWETQSQADPTGFHVNLLEVGGTAQTANDNGADINTLVTRVGTPSNFGSGTSTLAANLEDLADDGTATYDRSTDSQQAIRDRGDAAWTTGAGGTPPQLLQTTTIATLATQTSFTLTAGSADNDAYNNAIAVVTDSSTAAQKAVGTISDYVGSTRTVTLAADPAIFTMAVGDTIDIIAALGSATGDATAANQTTILNRLGTPADLGGGATVANNLSDIEGQTDDIGAAGAGLTEAGGTGDQLTAVPYNSSWSAEIRTAIGLATANMDTQLSTIDQNVDDVEAATVLASGTCDSGTTTTCVDATLTQVNDYWNGAAIVFTSGTIAGQTSCVYDFVAASDTLTFRARTAAVSTNTYVLVESATCEGVVAP